jgi:hypothetical protein
MAPTPTCVTLYLSPYLRLYLLAKLGDPYNRWLPAKQYQDFRIGNDGQLQGVGMLIASDPQSGRLVVLAPIKGSPADQAGIQPGDEVRSMLQCRLLAGSQQACLPACPCRNEETAASPSVSPSASPFCPFAPLQFETPEEAAAAIMQLHDSELGGRKIWIRWE